jgi:hypothetical protein
MSTLIIRKRSLKTWLHTDSILGDFIISKFYFNADNVSFQIVEQGQSRRVIYNITDITLYALPTGGTPETFANITALSLRLEELNYPAFQYDGQITSIANLIEAGTGVTITGDGTAESPYIINSTGGGGSQTLAQTLDNGNQTGGENILVNNGDAIELENGSKLSQGIVDAGTGGNKGIALTCAVGFEWKFEAGEAYLTETTSGYISLKQYARSIPFPTDDITKGYVSGSKWYTNDFTYFYECTDGTTGAAVWEQRFAEVNLTQVLTSGDKAFQQIDGSRDFELADRLKYSLITGGMTMTLDDDLDLFPENSLIQFFVANDTIPATATLNITAGTQCYYLSETITTLTLNVGDFCELKKVGSGNFWILNVWNRSTGGGGTIPTTTSQLTNDGADGVNPFITALDIPTTGQASTLVREVKNMTGATLTKGTVVYISGANGNKPLVSKALATTDALSSRTFGMLQSNINNNGTGNCVIIGDLSGLDTSAFTEGAQLYLSGVTAGTYTDTKILAPTHLVYVGKVTRSHPTQGQIEVGIQNGYELEEIHDVQIITPLNNQALTYETSTDLWKNKTIIEDSITNGVTTIAPSQNAVFDALALKQAALSYTPYRNVQTSQTVHTGTTSETPIFTATIPANAFNSNDVMKVLFGANKSTGLGTYVLRLRVNTTNTILGAPTIALYNGTATSQISLMMRNFSLNGGNLYGLGGSNSGITDIVAVGSTLGSTALNPANQFFIFATITLQNSGDSIIGNMLSIHN